MLRYSGTIAMLLLALPGLAGATADDTEPFASRADWLLNRGAANLAGYGGPVFQQTEIGGGLSADQGEGIGGGAAVLPMLMSMVLPGAGEAYLGHKRGFLMMALDLAAWAGVSHFNTQGNEKRDEYYAYADDHWDEDQLVAAYNPLHPDENIAGVGNQYFQSVEPAQSTDDFERDEGGLPLWVSFEDDRREYYENLGKWDQFIFGWDDFRHPQELEGASDPYVYEVTDLRDPRVSQHREIYRGMRQDSNNQFTNRDRLVYFNLAMRVFSIFQVAYLEGLLGGEGNELGTSIGGHQVSLRTQCYGLTSTRIGAAVSF